MTLHAVITPTFPPTEPPTELPFCEDIVGYVDSKGYACPDFVGQNCRSVELFTAWGYSSYYGMARHYGKLSKELWSVSNLQTDQGTD